MSYKLKKDQAAAARRYYERNVEKMKARAIIAKRDARARNKRVLIEHLQTHPCVDCGEKDIVLLEFDHVRGVKLRDISTMVRMPAGMVSLLAEIKKCDIRCVKCHRKRTAKGILGFRSL